MSFKSSFIALIMLFSFASTQVSAQKYFTRDADINFDATAKGSPEDITAKQNSGTVILDLASGKVQSSVLIKSFLFERALMQEHFNENYMESGKFPKAVFKGQLSKVDNESLKKDGTYTFTVMGEMEMHGKKNKLSAPFKFTVKNGKISATGDFALPLAAYDIDIPSVVADKVAREVTVTVSASLEAMKK